MGDAPLPESIAQGRYVDLKLAGVGGSAIVYQAWDTSLKRKVAIKLLKAAASQSETDDRFVREAQLAAGLVHPHIVAVYDVGTDNGHRYISMELVDGSNLKELIQARPPGGIPLPEVLRIAREVCDALAYAHIRGIIHCDVKPENVMLTREAQVKLADFGLARALDRPRAANQVGPVGTPAYIAPEVLRRRDPDARSDLYSFGAVLYEMMTGRPPFVGDDDRAVESSQINDVPIPPSALVPNVSAGLQAIVLRLLEKNPEARYGSAKEVLAALTSVAATSPVEPAASDKSPQGGDRAPPREAVDRLPRSTPYVDERHGLETLRRAVDAVAQGASRMVFLTGEAGVGKSRLAEEATKYARGRQFRCLGARCFRADRASPYAPWKQLLNSATGKFTAEEIWRIPRASMVQVAKLNPDLAVQLAAEPAASTGIAEQDRLQFFEGMSQFFVALSRIEPVLITIDDFQWADRASLDLLAHFSHLTKDNRIIVLAMYRDADLEDESPLSQLVQTLVRDPIFELFRLTSLDRAGVRQMLIGLFDESVATPEFVDFIVRKTGGNPYFVEQVLSKLVADEVVCWRSNHWEVGSYSTAPIPPTVRAVVKERLAKYDEESLQTLRLAAVVGEEFALQVLQGVSELNEDRLLEILDRFVRNGILREKPDDRTDANFQFVEHPTFEVLYDEVGHLKRRRYHLKVVLRLEQLSQQGTKVSVDELARQALSAGDVPRSVKYSIEAGDQSLLVYANADALNHYRNALNRLPAGPDAALRASVLDRVAKTAYMLALPPEEMAALLEAAEIYDKLGDARRAADFYLRMGRSYSWERLDAAKATEFEERALKLLEGAPESTELADALVTRGGFLAVHADTSGAVAVLERGRQLAQRFGDQRNEGYAVQYLGLSRRIEEADAAQTDMQRGVELMTARKAVSVSTAYLLQAEATFLATGDCAVAQRYFHAAIEDARIRGLLGHRLAALAELAHYVLLPTAKWDDATKYAREVLDTSPEDFAIPRFYAHVTLGPIAFARGSVAESNDHFGRALAIISRASQVSFVLPGPVGFAKQLLLQSAFKQALDVLEPGLELLTRSPPNVLNTLPLLACQLARIEALLGIGRVDQAKSALAEMGRLDPAVLARPWAVAMVHRADGLIRLGAGENEAAARALLAASLAYDELNWKLDLAASEFQLATCLEKTGERERSVEGLQRALDLYSGVGARPAVDRVLAHLSVLKA